MRTYLKPEWLERFIYNENANKEDKKRFMKFQQPCLEVELEAQYPFPMSNGRIKSKHTSSYP